MQPLGKTPFHKHRLSWRKFLPRTFPLILLLSLWAIFFRELFLDGKTLFFRDSLIQDLPLKWVFRQTFTWRPSFWNPLLSLGHPSFASPNHGVFYPPQWLTLVGDFFRSFNFYVALHELLSLGLLYAAARALGAEQWGAVVAAAMYTLGGFGISRLYEPNHYASLAWAPGPLWAFAKWQEQRNARWLACGALFAALQILAGEPHFSLSLFLLLLAYGLSQPERWKNLWPLGLMLGLGVLLSAIQWIPSWELLRLSWRSQGFAWKDATQWSFHPLRLVEFFHPGFFGNPNPSLASYWGSFLFNDYLGLPFSLSVYLGALPLIMILTESWRHRRRSHLFWLLASLGGLGLAFGPHFPGYGFLQMLPLLRNMRFPEKFLFVSSLSGSIFVGLHWKYFLERPRQSLSAALFLLGLSTLSLIAHPMVFGHFAKTIPRTMIEQSRFASYLSVLHSTLALALFSGILWRYSKSPQPRRWVGCLVAVCLFDLFFASSRILYVSEAASLTRIPAWLEKVNELRGARLYRPMENIGKPPGPPEKPPKLKEFSEHYRQALYPNIGHFWAISYPSGYESFGLASTASLITRSIDIFDYARISGSSFLLLDVQTSVPATYKLEVEDKFARLRLWRSDNPLERAYLVTKSVEAPDAATALEWVTAKGFPLADTVALVRSNPPPIALNSSALPALPRWLRDQPEEIELETSTEQPSILVLNDAYYPGWEASIDGKVSPILLVNGYARGVALTDGKHRVRFSFHPPSLRVGLALSVLGMLGILLLWTLRSVKRP